MELCIISPIPLLEELAGRSKYHLTLAHLFEHQDYRLFYKARVLAGDFVILDNGAYELDEAIPDEDLLAIARDIGPSEVVVPDVMRDCHATIARAKVFMERWVDEAYSSQTQLMFVPQGQDIDEWVFCLCELHEMAKEYGIEYPTIGIFVKITEFIGFTHRVPLLGFLEGRVPEIVYMCPIHLLGCDRDLKEIREVPRTHPWVRSIDTAKMITLGLNGIKLSPHVEEYMRIPRDDEYFLDPHIHPGIKTWESYNVDVALKWVAGERVTA